MKRTVSGIMIMTLSIVMITALNIPIEQVNARPNVRSVNNRELQRYSRAPDAVIDPKKAALAATNHWSTLTCKTFCENDQYTRLNDLSQRYFDANNIRGFNDVELSNAYLDDDSAELIIGLDHTQPDNYNELLDLICDYSGEVVNTVSTDGKTSAVVADIPHVAISPFILEVEGLSRYVEPNMKFKVNLTPNDPDWSKQWGPVKIEADHAWDTQAGNRSVLAAVIDTGIDWNHPDLSVNYVPLGYDWVNNDTDPMDDYGHGTHCAGIIAATLNNHIGIAGLAQVSVMAEKGIDSDGYGYEDDLANAIVHAVDQGADILSNSWGGYGESALIHEAIQYAYEHNVLIVAAAGNEDTSNKLYPAAYDEVIAVTATDQNDNPASFTNFGDWVELAAPGVHIYSTMWNDIYRYASGTSMSTPHVAGVAALIWSQYPKMTRDQVRSQLRFTADDLGYPGFDVYNGYGRINAKNAVEQALVNNDLLISHLYTLPHVRRGNRATVNATLYNFGTNGQTNIEVQLLLNGSLANSTVVSSLPSAESITVSFSWIPLLEGVYNFTSYIVPVSGETATENNALSICILGRNAKIFRVPENYPTIQAAVDSTISGIGDEVKVAAGTYYEHLVINKSLTLTGEDRTTTIIDGNGHGTVVHITALPFTRARIYNVKGVNLTGFTIRNGFQGVKMVACSAGNISENVICNNLDGLQLFASRSCTLRDNNIIGERYNFDVFGYAGESHYLHDIDTSNTVDGKPIYYWINEHDKQVPLDAGYVAAVNCTNIRVKDLNLEHNGQGVLLVWTMNSTIENVYFHQNYMGIDLEESSFNTINGNTMTENMLGILLYSHSNGNNITENNIEGNEPPGGLCGICLSRGSSNNTITGNTVSNNTWILGYGIRLEYYSNDNAIFHNDFVGNFVHASVFLSFNNTWDNGYPSGGNYWTSFTSTDSYYGPYQNKTGNDGMWDTPYMIDSDNQDNYALVTNFSYWTDPILGDLNFDEKVDIKDISIAASAYGSFPGNPRWNPIADVNQDDNVDIRDIALVARHFGETNP